MVGLNWQITGEFWGLLGTAGERGPRKYSNLLIRLTVPDNSSPSLSTEYLNKINILRGSRLRQLANKLANQGTGGDRRECRLRSRRVGDTRHRFRGRVGRRNVGICVLLRSHFHPCSALRPDPDSGRWTVSRRWGGSGHLDLRLQPTAVSALTASSFSIRAQRCAPWDSGSGGEGKDGWRPVRMSQIGQLPTRCTQR